MTRKRMGLITVIAAIAVGGCTADERVDAERMAIINGVPWDREYYAAHVPGSLDIVASVRDTIRNTITLDTLYHAASMTLSAPAVQRPVNVLLECLLYDGIGGVDTLAFSKTGSVYFRGRVTALRWETLNIVLGHLPADYARQIRRIGEWWFPEHELY